jgi:hypothetical protein
LYGRLVNKRVHSADDIQPLLRACSIWRWGCGLVMSRSNRSPNDQRSDALNPNNQDFEDSRDNRSDQKNPNNQDSEDSRDNRSDQKNPNNPA